MTDDQMRQLIRSAIAKHLGGPPPSPPASGPSSPGVPIAFARYALGRAPDDTMCLIEPAVTCNHCGYCQCHGH
ncbi:MAG: hypothetical protein IT180_14955 [Acidobacteria bacterium]|nr:hypothetical protein [Acidobacteriota bacterium]